MLDSCAPFQVRFSVPQQVLTSAGRPGTWSSGSWDRSRCGTMAARSPLGGPQAAGAARRAPPPPQRGRPRRSADRRALGRGLARARRRRAAGQRLAAAQGASAGRADDQIARLRPPGRARRPRPPPLRAPRGRGKEPARPRPRSRRGGAAPRRALALARPGARGLRLRELRPARRSPGSRRSGSRQSSSGSRPTSRSDATTT